jgi:3D (Asp-Asp-Asp) domain-containing protein
LRSPIVIVLLACLGTTARADDSKLRKEGVAPDARSDVRPKRKACCGYPITRELEYRLTFYWMADESRHDLDQPAIEIYSDDGFYLGAFPKTFVDELRMEGSAWLEDGRVLNYAGRCRLGVGTCFQTLDGVDYPYGRGAGRRPLVPFRSVAIDRRLIAIGEPLYIPEFDGMPLPDGSIHDGCVRADDTGGAIKQRLMDFFVVELENFRWVRDALWGVRWFTPHIEAPRCEYLRDSATGR